MQPSALGGVIPFVDNVEIRVFDKDGNIKPIWQENRLHRWFLEHNIILPKIPFLLGHWSDVKIGHNLICNAGRAVVSARLYGTASAAFASIGMGTNSTAANAADTTLGTEVTASGSGASGVHVIAAATTSSVTTTVTNDTAQFVGTVSITGTIAVTESGLFNATTNGSLLAHQVFSAINVVSGDSIQFTWQIKNA